MENNIDNSSMNSELASNPDYVEYYVSDLPYVQTNTSADGSTYSGRLIADRKDGKTNGYLTFMGGDIPLATIKTENTNGKKIIVFKESYGNAFVPFLVGNFDRIYVENVTVHGKINSFIRKWSDGKIDINNLKCDCNSQVETATEEFKSKTV
jgi:hypothetical protein